MLRRHDDLYQTIVIFTSDNGYLLGEHRTSGKNVAYEEAIRNVLLMRGPGFRPGAVAATGSWATSGTSLRRPACASAASTVSPDRLRRRSGTPPRPTGADRRLD